MKRHLPLIFAMLCSACRDAPTSPSAAASPSATPPTPVATVRVAGVVGDGDRDAPIGEAFVKVVAMGGPGGSREVFNPAWSALTDSNGVFGFDLPADWSYLLLEAVRPGYESSRTHVDSEAAASVVLKVQPTLTIQPGESLETRIIDTRGSSFFPCRRAFVEAPPGDVVDIEVTPRDSQGIVGLQAPLKPFGSTYERRLTVSSSGEFWIVGDEPLPFVPVTLTATRHRRSGSVHP